MKWFKCRCNGTELVTKFQGSAHWNGDFDPVEYADIASCYPAKPPHEILGPLTEHYRKLEYLGIPMDVQRVGYHHETDRQDGWYGQYGREGPPDWQRMVSENQRRLYRASYEIWVAVRRIKEIYIDCGWNVDAVEQTEFRREEFIERRARHLAEVVEPLRRAEQLLRDEINWEEMHNGDYGGWTYSHSRAADIFGQRQCLEQRPGGEGSLLSETRSEAQW